MKRTNAQTQIMEAMANMSSMLESIVAEQKTMRLEIDALKVVPAATPKKSTAKKATKSETKVAPKKTSTKKSAPKTEAKTKVAITTNLADFEPCKFKGTDNYVWGGAKGYKAMRSAYCYAKQTNGMARNLADARALGIQIDFDKAWNKAKAEFEKKYKYIKAEDRQ